MAQSEEKIKQPYRLKIMAIAESDYMEEPYHEEILVQRYEDHDQMKAEQKVLFAAASDAVKEALLTLE